MLGWLWNVLAPVDSKFIELWKYIVDLREVIEKQQNSVFQFIKNLISFFDLSR